MSQHLDSSHISSCYDLGYPNEMSFFLELPFADPRQRVETGLKIKTVEIYREITSTDYCCGAAVDLDSTWTREISFDLIIAHLLCRFQ